MNAYLFDLDGTLADISHRLHLIEGEAKDWPAFYAACGGDKPIDYMVDLVTRIHEGGGHVVYVTGRSDECLEQTREWLCRVGIDLGPVYMRRAGDYRQDDVVKLELLEQVKADGYVPVMAFEDRSRVVKAYRDTGLLCVQVAQGDF